jgi:beta-lactamase regulating signal transducer with metallopeptidase domain
MDLFLNSIIAITAVAAGILLLKWVFRNKLSPQLHYYLWMILVIRLLLIFFPQDFLPTYRILPTINNVETSVQTIEYNNTDEIQEQPARISADIVFQNYTKPFSISKNIKSSVTYAGFAGTVLLLAFFLIVYFLFKIKLGKIDCVYDEVLLIILSEYKKKMNIKADITIKLYGNTPMLAGIRKPVIILPEEYNVNDASHMIIHELCHLKHHDLLLNMLSTIFLCLNWYNPIIWLSCSAFRSDLEVLCDFKVMEMTANKKQYASLLLNTSLNGAPNMPMTTWMSSGKKEIKRRIEYMANFRKPNFIWTTVIIIAITLLSAGCLAGRVSSTNTKDKWAPPFKGLKVSVKLQSG